MNLKWKPIDWSQHPYPERQSDYLTYEALEDESGNWLATIEQFIANDRWFYANTGDTRSGPLSSYEQAKQWCEYNVGMQN